MDYIVLKANNYFDFICRAFVLFAFCILSTKTYVKRIQSVISPFHSFDLL